MGTPCRHPAIGALDNTQKAQVGDQYAARHNPFVYFLLASIENLFGLPHIGYAATPGLATFGLDVFNR
jgi:hypothetical protein